jgi:Protein of unknown function (DUF1353)
MAPADVPLPPATTAEVEALVARLLAGDAAGPELAEEAVRLAEASTAGGSAAPVVVGRIRPGDGAATPFFDPTEPTRAPEITLHRILHGNATSDRAELFTLEHRIGYWDAHRGGVIVPAVLTMPTDLTSVPSLFTWLVPKTGLHLPAALVHDGLVFSRTEADRILRDGMRDLGAGPIRRWLVWTAVAMATAVEDPRSTLVRFYWWVVLVASMVLYSVLGIAATVDLLDEAEVLPWMGTRSTTAELLLGALMAMAIPVAVAIGFWWGQRRAGIIAGVALAFLLHVTIAIVVVYSGYLIAENSAQRRWRNAGVGALGLVAAAGLPTALVWVLTR